MRLLDVARDDDRDVRSARSARRDASHLRREPVARRTDAANGVRLAGERVARVEGYKLRYGRVHALRVNLGEHASQLCGGSLRDEGDSGAFRPDVGRRTFAAKQGVHMGCRRGLGVAGTQGICIPEGSGEEGEEEKAVGDVGGLQRTREHVDQYSCVLHHIAYLSFCVGHVSHFAAV